MVVLNTCCIRENADNKLYGTLGHLKSLKAARPGLEIVVGGCLAQKDRDLIQARAGHVDVVFGTHNVHRAVELLARLARRRPAHRDLGGDGARRGRGVPVGAAGPPGHRLRRLGHDPDRLRQLVRVLHRARGAGPRDQPAVRRARRARSRRWPTTASVEVTLLGQNVNSYGRDLTTAAAHRRRQCPRRAGWPARRGLAIRDAGPDRCSPTCSTRWPASRASGGSATPAPTRRTCGPRPSRPWRPTRPCARTSTSRCSPAAMPCWPPCTGATPPSATSSGWPWPGRRSPTWP